MDSLYFEVFQGTWDPNFYELQWSINRFTGSSFVPYTGGVWLKDRSYTENTWENVHMMNAGSDGSVSIQFYGTGQNAVSVLGNNIHSNGFQFRLIAVSDTSFDAYQVLPDGTTELIESGIVPRSMGGEPPYILDTEDGWFIKFESGSGYTVGDYWDVVVKSFFEENNPYNAPLNYLQPRGSLKKVNTIQIQLVEKATNKVAQQEVKIIGFGKQPHGHHILFVTADSSDVISMLGIRNNDDVRCNVYLHILNSNGLVEFQGLVEWDKAAASSVYIPNVGVAFKARGELGSKNMTTSIYGTHGEKVDKIKMRVGGNRQYGGYSLNEINLNILNDINLKLLGGVKNSVATWYLNGSYWSLAFPQEQPRKRFYADVLKIKDSEVDVLKPNYPLFFIHSYYPGEENGEKGNFVIFDKETSVKLGLLDSIVFLPLSFVNLEEDIFLIKNKNKDKFQLVSNLQDGNGTYLKERLEKLIELDVNFQNHDEILFNQIEIDLWAYYISFIHFTSMKDVIYNNTSLAASVKIKIFPILNDLDGATGSIGDHSNWHFIFGYIPDNNPEDFDIIPRILYFFNSSPSAMSRLALVYQDLLNTALLPERTTKIVQEMRDLVMPHYEEYHQSWGGSPNGGQTPEHQAGLYVHLEQFYNERPEHAFQLMADYVLAEHGFVNDDRNRVNIVFDSIPQGIVEVKFNSLTLYENFSGLYFPKPYVEFVFHGPAGISVKEYPDLQSGDTLKISADTILTFTLVMHGSSDSVVSSIKDFRKSNVVLYPNPTQDMLNIDIDCFQTNPLFVEIYDSMGVKSIMPLKQKAVDVSSLANGHYIIKIIDGENSYKGQFVKVK